MSKVQKKIIQSAIKKAGKKSDIPLFGQIRFDFFYIVQIFCQLHKMAIFLVSCICGYLSHNYLA